MVKGAAQGGLDTSNAALTGTMDTAKGTVQTSLDTSKHMLIGMKDTVCAGVTSAMNMAKGIHKNRDTTRDTQSSVLAHSGNVATNAIHTGVHTVPSSLSGSHSIICHEPSIYRATNHGVGQAILTSTESLCCETSSFSDTYGLGHVTEPRADTKTLVSGMASSARAATRSVEECGQLAATGFAALPDELKGLGDIFQPMTTEEQGECLCPSLSRVPRAWALVRPYTHSGCLKAPFRLSLIAFLQLSWQSQSQGPEYSLLTGEATTSVWVTWPLASASGPSNMP